jgi:hypothetical protein
MGFHSEGTMILKNEEGKIFEYKVQTFGAALILNGPDGQWEHICEKRPILISKLKSQIQDLKDELKDKKATLKALEALEIS